jgi:hypothetical protein
MDVMHSLAKSASSRNGAADGAADKLSQTTTGEYAARRIAERYALDLALAKTITRLAGLGEDEARS